MTKILQIDREAAETYCMFERHSEETLAGLLASHREQATAELVEALQWCVDYFDGNTRCNAKQMDNCIEKCREALAKASPDAR